MNLAWSKSVLVSLPAAFLLCGCPSPNNYTVPRTLDRGQVQWQVAAEFIGVSYNQPTTTTNANGTTSTQNQNVSASAPMLPTFGARIGLADGFDLGLRVANLDSLGIDGKIRLLKGRFDLAVDPGIQGYYVTVDDVSLGVVYLHLPLLAGINFNKDITLVLKPGIIYSVATASASSGSGVEGVASSTGVFGDFGAGFDFRIGKRFSIHPEVTVMPQFGASNNALVWVGGVGFNIGAQPDYSDLDDSAPETAPAPPAAAPSAAPAPAPSDSK
jgi:hypothetical protein